MIPIDKLRSIAKKYPEKIALTRGNENLTFSELAVHAERAVQHLHHIGASGANHAAFISPNRIEVIIWLAACATLKIPATGIDFTLPFEVQKSIVSRMGSEILIIAADSVDSGPLWWDTNSICIIDVDAELPSLLEKPSNTVEGMILELGAERRPFRAVGVTSGTSGTPKLTLRTNSFDARRFAFFTENFGFSADDRFLVALPLYHAAGNGWARLFLSLGARVDLVDGYKAANLAETMVALSTTATVMTPPLLELLVMNTTTLDASRPEALRWLLCGGKNLAPIVKLRALATLGPVIYEYYGSTETGVNVLAFPVDLASHPDSVGQAFDGNRIIIVDETGARLPIGTVGRVAIASYMNMDSYLDGSSEAIMLEDERYLLTCDMGRLDPEGRLFLENRVASSKSDKLIPFYRLENRLRSFPCISDAALRALPRQWPSIEVVLKLTHPGASLSAALLALIHEVVCNENISLGEVRVLSSIPYSPSGKIRLPELSVA